MKKLISLTLGAAVLAGSAFAVGPFGPPKASGFIWQCNPNPNGAQTGLQWCRTNITSGTTATQLSSVNINPAQHVYVSAGVSGSGVANVVTPTLSFSLGGKVVGTQNISVSTAPNVVDLGNVPYFDAISVSETQPTLISASNGLFITIIGNDK